MTVPTLPRRTAVQLFCIVATLLGAAQSAPAQVSPWFNGLGVSLGGGPWTSRGESSDPVTHFVQPTGDTGGTASVGALLSLGTRRWALLLPEFHAFTPMSSMPDSVDASLRVGGQTLDFPVDRQTTSVYVVTVGAQMSPFRTGRLWLRGGLGQGWIGRSIRAQGPDIVVHLSSGTDLALSGALGARIWGKSLDRDHTMTVDLEGHYVRVRQDHLNIAVPSVRMAWHIVFVPIRGG